MMDLSSSNNLSDSGGRSVTVCSVMPVITVILRIREKVNRMRVGRYATLGPVINHFIRHVVGVA